MPTYEYACGKCGHEFEREQRITEDPVKTCPECRSRKVERLISATSFVLKGGGWYSDLYASPDAKGKSSDAAATDAGAASADKPAAPEPTEPAAKSAKTAPKPKAKGKPGAAKTPGKQPA